MLKLAMIVALLAPLCGCEEGTIAIIGKSPITPGIYNGMRECVATVNGVETSGTGSIRFTIDNDGLLVLNGDTIHVGLLNEFETGAASQSSVIQAITVTNDGFTIDWDTTLVVQGVSLEGFVLESYKAQGANSMEFRSSLVATTSEASLTEECVAVLSR